MASASWIISKKIIKILNQLIGQQFQTKNEQAIEEILDDLQEYIEGAFPDGRRIYAEASLFRLSGAAE